MSLQRQQKKMEHEEGGGSAHVKVKGHDALRPTRWLLFRESSSFFHLLHLHLLLVLPGGSPLGYSRSSLNYFAKFWRENLDRPIGWPDAFVNPTKIINYDTIVSSDIHNAATSRP